MNKGKFFLIVLAGTLIGGALGYQVSEHFRKEAALESLEKEIQETNISTGDVLKRLESIDPELAKKQAKEISDALNAAGAETEANPTPTPTPAG